MAAVTRVKAHPCTPVGYEYVQVGILKEAVVAGDLLVQDTDFKWKKATAGVLEANGIALKDGYLGQGGFDIGIVGEMDGFSGLTNAPLYPSAAVAGGIDTTAPVGATTRIRGIRATRIYYSFI